MPECRNCGSHVTRRYITVHSRDGHGVDVCPHCPDRVRRHGEPRESRSTKHFSEDGNEGGEWT